MLDLLWFQAGGWEDGWRRSGAANQTASYLDRTQEDQVHCSYVINLSTLFFTPTQVSCGITSLQVNILLFLSLHKEA